MKKRTSLSVKLTLTMLLLVFGIIALCWGMNRLFLEQYYIHEKKEALFGTFGTLGVAYEEGRLYDDSFDVTFEKLCANGNMNILIIDANNDIVRASANEVGLMMAQLKDMILGNIGEGSRVLEKTNYYTLVHQLDSRLKAEYLVLWGAIGDGCYVYARTAMESIRESASITNYFFLRVGIIGIGISAVVIFLLVKRLMAPIRELADVSRAMTDLRFEVKYRGEKSDSSELAELGEHMNYMSYTLEQTISELKKANNELKQDIAQKEELDEMRREFLSNVSHELKTPIALIQGYAEGLKDGIIEDAESRSYYCDVITDEANKMNRLVKQLLNLNQLESGAEQVEMTRFNISEMIQALVQPKRLLADQQGIQIEFEEKEHYVWGDAFRVEDVLTNYIVNAINHAQGEKKIRIYYESHDNLLRICVANTGANIPEEELDKLWIKFYKVDKARTREYGGSGVGLSIVKASMDSMHQACGVKNLTNGVEFWFELENGCITD